MTPIHVEIRVTRINPICCFEKVLQLVQGKFLQLNGACTIFLPAFLPLIPEYVFNSLFFFFLLITLCTIWKNRSDLLVILVPLQPFYFKITSLIRIALLCSMQNIQYHSLLIRSM